MRIWYWTELITIDKDKNKIFYNITAYNIAALNRTSPDLFKVSL